MQMQSLQNYQQLNNIVDESKAVPAQGGRQINAASMLELENQARGPSPNQPQSNGFGFSIKPALDENERPGGANEQLQEDKPSSPKEDIQPQSIAPPATTEDKNMSVLNEIKDKINSDEFDFIKEKIQASDKKILMMIKCYTKNND